MDPIKRVIDRPMRDKEEDGSADFDQNYGSFKVPLPHGPKWREAESTMPKSGKK